MSEFVYFSCPGVRIWGFPSFSKTVQKIEKIKVFDHRGPGELFWLNSLMCPFSIQMIEFVYFSCPRVRIWGFSSFLKTFQKIEKIEVFAHSGSGELFWLNSLMCPFFIQMSEFVYFSCPVVRIWGFSSFSKTFQKVEKIEIFDHCGPGKLFWLNSSMYPFSIPMSEFVYISCPGVRIWGFSSFSKTFQEIEKIEVFSHSGPKERFWLSSLMCPFSIQMSEFVYFSFPGVRMRIFFLFENFSKNQKKFSPTADHGNFFFSILSCAHFPSKWVNLYILVVLEWEYEDFLHFRKLFFFKKSKKLKFSPIADLGNFFGSIHSCAHFPSKRVNLNILLVLEWVYEDFLHFRKLFKK